MFIWALEILNDKSKLLGIFKMNTVDGVLQLPSDPQEIQIPTLKKVANVAFPVSPFS